MPLRCRARAIIAAAEPKNGCGKADVPTVVG
jgi:hypothetical protein